MNSILPTEEDGEWIGRVLEGVIPDQLEGSSWVQQEAHEVSGVLVNPFKFIRSDLSVAVSVSPVVQKGAENRKVSYHLVICNVVGKKIKKATDAQINRAKDVFICRSLAPEELIFEGTQGGSKAHHVICLFEEKSRIIT